jgi:hypothetical protein
MQQTILNSLFQLHNVTTEQAKATFLQNHQAPALDVWRAFRAFPVRVNYTRQDIQSVYMLRYFPPYSQIIKIILNALHHNRGHLPFNGQTLGASFIGCGPSPEIYGFFEFLNSTAFRPQQVRVNTFDIYSDHWAFSRNITFQSLIPRVWNHSPILPTNNNLNIASHNSLQPFATTFQNSNLVVFQNCLNEIPENLHSVVRNNLKTIIDNIPTGAIILIIDLLGYQPVLDLLAYLEDDTELIQSVEILRSSRQGEQSYDAKELVNAIPPIVRQHFLTGIPFQVENGLIPRRYIKYHHLTMRKR